MQAAKAGSLGEQRRCFPSKLVVGNETLQTGGGRYQVTGPQSPQKRAGMLGAVLETISVML